MDATFHMRKVYAVRSLLVTVIKSTGSNYMFTSSICVSTYDIITETVAKKLANVPTILEATLLGMEHFSTKICLMNNIFSRGF